MSDPADQSPISPGRAYYQDTLAAPPRHRRLDADLTSDVVIVGGGFTGVCAAAHLARQGVGVVLLEQGRLGDGASGRNGGQLGTGHRLWPEELEPSLGLARSRALFELAEDAKHHLIAFCADHSIDVDLGQGQLSLAHRRRFLDAYRRHAEILATRYDYPHTQFQDRAAMAALLGSERYHGGLRDAGTWHLNPLKLLVGTAAVADAAGARLFEGTRVTRLDAANGRVVAHTAHGRVSAERALVATNAHGGDIDAAAAAHIMPIRSFMVATEPLAEPERVIPGGEAADDSRFVVRYFRKSADGRLLFGGREAYMPETGDIAGPIARQIADIYPHLADVPISHAWGGSVGITMTRMPFVRATRPGVTVIGGFSGHGVMLANYFGALYAGQVAGAPDRLAQLRELKIPPFPGGAALRSPLLLLAMTWFSLRDRI